MITRVVLRLFFVLITSTFFSSAACALTCLADTCVIDGINAEMRMLVDNDHARALRYADSAIRLSRKINSEKHLADSYNSMATVMRKMGEYDKAVDYYLLTRSIHEKNSDNRGMAYCNAQIGIIHQSKGDFSKALRYYRIAEPLINSSPDVWARGKLFEAMASCYGVLSLSDSAFLYYGKSGFSFLSLNDSSAYSQLLGNIASLHLRLNALDSATFYAAKSIDWARGSNNLLAIAQGKLVMSDVFLKQKKFSKAISVLLEIEELLPRVPGKDVRMEMHSRLSSAFEGVADFRNALSQHKLFVLYKDSISSENLSNEITRKELTYEFSREQMKDSLLYAEEKSKQNLVIEKQNATIARERIQKLLFGLGVIAFLLLSLFIFINYRNKKKAHEIIAAQKAEVEHQKDLLEEKNREILDSITYAKRIQTAILPPQKIVKEYLPDSFILYKPKDIVAGDFYWMETFRLRGQAESDKGYILFSAADCTGHGVPGAMVSVVCNNALNRAVREYGLINPGEILDKVRELVIGEFEKSEEEVKDGMDISLCALSLNENRLLWSGANNPLWLIRNNELIEYKPNKQPIGKYANPKPFTSHQIDLQKGDTFYIFTDGYEDQFGGEKGKKFKTAAMKQLFLSMQKLDMNKQRVEIDRIFEDWKGNLEQVDDVCVIGVRV